MLNYYQIDMGGSKNEKMTKRDQKKFLDNLNVNFDAHTVNDLLSKIKDKIQDNKPQDEESDDPFFDKLKEGLESDFFRNTSHDTDMNMPTKGIGLTKRALNQSWDNTLQEQLNLEELLQTEAGKTEDFKEGVSAFLEKRKPVFNGK